MILVTDVNDEAPRFLQEPYTVQIPEVNLGPRQGPCIPAPDPACPLGLPWPGPEALALSQGPPITHCLWGLPRTPPTPHCHSSHMHSPQRTVRLPFSKS